MGEQMANLLGGEPGARPATSLLDGRGARLSTAELAKS
jgi:hypothetical protein